MIKNIDTINYKRSKIFTKNHLYTLGTVRVDETRIQYLL